MRRAGRPSGGPLFFLGARVTDVAFFDYDHGQIGVAPNAIELHPILSLRGSF